MFAEILLLRKLPKSIDYFDYLVPEELEKEIKVGQAVTVPFRHQEVKGIVLNLKKKTAFKKVKPIFSIPKKKPVLTANQLRLSRFVSAYYYVSLSTIVRQIVPPALKRPRPAKEKKEKFAKTPTDKKIKALAKKLSGQKEKKFLFLYLNEEKKIYFYLSLIDLFLRKKKQIVLLFPEIAEVNKFYTRLTPAGRKKTALIHHKQAKSELYSAFDRIKSGRAKIILGTPLSVFSPFKNLGLIIIDQEESQNHKQADQNPRFNAKKVAEELAELSRAKLVFASLSPSIETFFRAQKGDFARINSEEKNKTSTEIVRHLNTGRQFFAETLTEKIFKALNQGKKALLLVNRKGWSRSLQCLDCQHVFSCPACQIPFVLHKEERGFYLLCHRCGQKRDMPLTCPRCQGSRLKNVGIGTEQVKNEAIRVFPERKISLFEAPLPDKIDLSQTEIIIATLAILKHLKWLEIGLVGLIDADTFLYLPDFRAQEKTFQLLTRILGSLQASQNSEMLIQTASPLKPPLKYFPDKYPAFYRQELKLRKQFSYPPFSRLIKISSQSEKAWLSLKNAETLSRTLKEKNQSKAIIISPVVPAFVFRRLGRYYHQIILKIRPEAQEKEVRALIDLVPDEFIIDVDPENLL